MQLSKHELPQRFEADAGPPADYGAEKGVATGTPETLSVVEQESLILNLDASLRVHSRPHFFS